MPLQKVPPQFAFAAENSHLTRKHILQARRRTLQTVNELSSDSSSPSDWSDKSPTQTNNSSLDSRVSQTTYETINGPKKERPRTLGYGPELRTQPSITITAAETAQVRRSFTSPLDLRQGDSMHLSIAKINPDRLSASLPLRQTSSKETQAVIREVQRGAVDVDERRLLHEPGRERAMTGSKGRHNTEKRAIKMGSSSTLPSMSPLPVTPPAAVHFRNQQQLLQNSRSMGRTHTPSHTDRRISHGHIERHLDSTAIDAQLLKRASTNSSPHFSTHMDPMSRPRSTSYNTAAASRTMTNGNPMPPLFRSPHPRSTSGTPRPNLYAFPTPPAGTATDGRASRSAVQTQRPAIRSTSMHSTHTAATSHSNVTQHSQQSRRSSASRSSYSTKPHAHQQGITKEHLEALATLTAPPSPGEGTMTPESLAYLKSQEKRLENKTRRASVASDRASRISYAQTNRSSRAGSRVSAHSYGTGTVRQYGTEDGLTPESIRLLREREKLLRWKAEREKREYERKEREKIRERVRRANEMELAKSMELEEKQKKQKKSRGCLGIFGR